MPRANRTLEEGMIYHVYNRVSGEAMPFSEDALAVRFLQVLRPVAERDGLEYGTRCLAPCFESVGPRPGYTPYDR